MKQRDGTALFNRIAPIYGLFFKYQQRRYHETIEGARAEFDFTRFASVLDVGCGTGALCSVLKAKGLAVTGIDPAEKMLRVAREQTAGQGIEFLQGNPGDGLPFADKSFDLAIASYVAHGLAKTERKKLYREMNRVARERVILFDYNQNRSPLTSFVEWMEGGDYFRFIKTAEDELRNCVADLKACFAEVRVVDVGKRAAWYICTPKTIVEETEHETSNYSGDKRV